LQLKILFRCQGPFFFVRKSRFFTSTDIAINPPSSSSSPNEAPGGLDGKEASAMPPNDNIISGAATKKANTPPSAKRQNVFMIFITLAQLVQMIPLGAGINSSLVIGEALGASRVESVWIVASYPLTQRAFVLIGMCLLC